MNDPLAQGAGLLATFVLVGLAVALVGLALQLARAVWAERAERRASMRRHPSLQDRLLLDRDREAWERIVRGWER